MMVCYGVVCARLCYNLLCMLIQHDGCDVALRDFIGVDLIDGVCVMLSCMYICALFLLVYCFVVLRFCVVYGWCVAMLCWLCNVCCFGYDVLLRCVTL